jgi:hypothetical protein
MHRILFAITITSLLACNEQPAERKNGFTPELKTKEDSLFHDVMQGHDVGMARIGQVRKYIDQTQKAIDSINKLSKPDEAYKQTLTELHNDLKTADSGMMAWMEAFKVDSGDNDRDLRIQYLESEKLKVEKVKEAILGSISRADSLFK